MSNIVQFQEEYPSLESYWRSIILFGRNVASYKFALAKSLLEIVPTGKTVITLDELSVPFSKHLCEHIKLSPKQTTSNSSQFLNSCKDYNEGKISHEQLLDVTVKKGFNNVIDAFHVVNDDKIPIKFYEKDNARGSKKIILTNDIYKLRDTVYYGNFMKEAESRWNLVETSWEIGVSRNLLNVQYDNNDRHLFVNLDNFRRKTVTSARDTLNGYQKGKCFYCFDDISVNDTDDITCDVDHFFPYALKFKYTYININGVWNLVLACPRCNRGADGKFAKVPVIKYLERLHKRNEFLISSYHPLRETLINQMGSTEEERISFLRKIDKLAINFLIHRWEAEQIGESVF